MSRRAARIAAVEVLYAADIRELAADKVLEEREAREPIAAYTAHLVAAVQRRRDELDALIAEEAIGWPLGRMSPIDRNVLRIGTLEILESNVPVAAVLDEAVRLAKRFSGERAGAFVNGVLAAVAESLQARESSSED